MTTRVVAAVMCTLALGACSSAAPETPTAPLPTASMAGSPSTVVPSSSPNPAGARWIVFQWGVNDVNALFLVRPDGTDLHRVPGTEAGSGAPSHPDWSPDGRSVAYLWHTGRDPDNIEIRAVSVDDGAVETIVPCSEASCMQVTGAAYSHDGNRIAFGEADHTPDGDQLAIVVLNLADGTRRVVARDVVGAAVFQEFGRPRWSADDRSLAFFVADWDPPTADTPRRTYIALVSVDGSDVDSPRSVVGLPAFASYPDVNPLEDRLIFDTRDEAWFHDGSSNIYSVRPDGSELTLLTDFLRPGERAVHPTYSADGSQILYTTFGLDGWPHLSVMNSDGTAPTVLDVAGMHPRLQPAP